jgi:hypothetical protein
LGSSPAYLGATVRSQTPTSAPLRSLWKKIGPRSISTILLTISALHFLGDAIQSHISRILRILFCLPSTGLNILPRFRPPPPPTIQEDPYTPIAREIIPWFVPGELTEIRLKNSNDVRG